MPPQPPFPPECESIIANVWYRLDSRHSPVRLISSRKEMMKKVFHFPAISEDAGKDSFTGKLKSKKRRGGKRETGMHITRAHRIDNPMNICMCMHSPSPLPGERDTRRLTPRSTRRGTAVALGVPSRVARSCEPPRRRRHRRHRRRSSAPTMNVQ